MSAPRLCVPLLAPFVLIVSISASSCGLVAGLKDDIQIDNGSGGAGGNAGTGGNAGAGGSGWMPSALPAGFVDSRNARCSDGTKLVDCESAQKTLPGQDGHYLSMTPEYEVLNENEVKETNTGLTWWRHSDVMLSWDQAQSVCQGIPGYRLPTRYELLSLLEFNSIGDTLLDESVFGEIKPGLFWTSTPYANSMVPLQTYWAVGLCSGCVDEADMYGISIASSAATLCVTGSSKINGPFTLQMDGTLLDDTTMLAWIPDRKAPADSGITWPEALAYCEKTSFGGHTDWRLPTIKELETIVDDTRTGSVSLFQGFGFSPGAMFLYSSTPDSTGGSFFQLLVDGGSVWTGNQDYMFATCVRNQP